MFLLGSAVNALGILFGSLLGLLIPKIPERMKNTVLQGIGLTVILIGLGMALSDHQSNDILIMIVSMVLGGVLGEWMNIEGFLNRVGMKMQGSVKNIYDGPLAEAFVASSLLFCVGSMAIVGAFQSGALGIQKTLYAKTLLDSFTAIVFTSTLGLGVALSALPVFLYEGAIATMSYFLGSSITSPSVIACVTATGGLLIVGIGINVLEIKRVSVGNLLPAIVLAGLIRALLPFVQHALH